MHISDEMFDKIADEAVASLPRELLDAMENVVIRVEEQPPPGQNLLGLYEGVPLTERGYAGSMVHVPDVITIFSGPLQASSRTFTELRQQIRITVLHEIAHHFGIDDDRLDELGWA